jgi:hypothetical protein
MRAYIAVTGILFLIVTGAHAWRFVVERTIVSSPWFIASTIVSLGMAVWAIRLLLHKVERRT